MASSSESHGSYDQNPQLFPKGAESPGDAKLGRFGHHPDPAIDFEIEVQSIEARLSDAVWGISKPGTEPETVESVITSIDRASSFRVGGDPGAVNAKRILRLLENTARSAISTAPEELQAPPVQNAGVPIRWLIEEKLPSGSIRWQCVEHENHARSLAADCKNPATLTPLCAQQGLQAAWQPGEREIAERWVVKLMSKLGTKPDYADDLLWLQRIHNLLFAAQPLKAEPATHIDGLPDPSEVMRRNAAAYVKACDNLAASQGLASSSVSEAPVMTEDWLRDTAMNVMLATEVEEATRILARAVKGGSDAQ